MTSAEKQRRLEEDQIVESLETVYTAFCNGCGAEINSNNHEDAFAKELYEKGWRVSDMGDLHCKKMS